MTECLPSPVTFSKASNITYIRKAYATPYIIFIQIDIIIRLFLKESNTQIICNHNEIRFLDIISFLLFTGRFYYYIRRSAGASTLRTTLSKELVNATHLAL